LQKVRCPVFVMAGERDLQVPPEQHLPVIEAALRAGGKGNVTIVRLPGLNHLFQPCQTGSPEEYVRIEQTFAPEALEALTRWIRQTCRLP
ncbi:MAG: alpha/beta hydrolase, partial [Phycisphaerae bacterium]|nr:alpha/beta hydrolase [Phycisphaerae bacterium]